MDLNNIKRNNLDYLLTDILPTELSDRFTYSHFYEYLLSKPKKVGQMVRDLEEIKAKPDGLFKGKEWASMPLKYTIMKDLCTVREISLVQPLAAIEMLLFVELYQKEILNLLNKNACFSLRYHHRNNNLCYKNRNKSITKYFSEESKDAGREILEQTGMFFDIAPYKAIATFTSSEEWFVLNSKYKYFIRTDYKACFDSIYSHTYTWLIGKGSIDTKCFGDNSNIFSVIDRLLQNINARRSNGIVVGPEFSRMIAELLLQSIDIAVYNKMINEGKKSGIDYNTYRYVDDIFIFAKSEEIAMQVVENYSEIARKYLLQLNESKLFSSRVPFVLDGWLNETNGFTNRMCNLLFTTKEEQKVYVDKIMTTDNNDSFNYMPYLLRSHVIRYGSKAKQSIMNQLNELICKYESKSRTIVAYFLSSILNHVGKNKEKVTVFKKDVKASTVFSFLDLVLYGYSFFPNYGNTQKLLQIISYVRDEYDIFRDEERLQDLFNKYVFVFDKANLNDVVNLLLFCRQSAIEISYVQEKNIVKKLEEKDDPVLWATYLIYSQYNRRYSLEIRDYIECKLREKIDSIRVKKSIYEYREFWWILVFNKCPFITDTTQKIIDNVIAQLKVPSQGCTKELINLFKDFLQNNPDQFFDWNINENDFLRTFTFKTHEKSIFKNYKETPISLAWGSF